MSEATRKQIVFMINSKSVTVDEFIGDTITTQDDDALQEIAERCMMMDHRIQGYHIKED